MKQILLTRGKLAIVDDEDFAWLSQFKWRAGKHSRDKWMAIRWAPRYRQQAKPVIYMHRAILNAPDGYEVDHINHDPLDNRRCNLRICTRSQNAQNNSLNSRNTSGYRGVSQVKSTGKWVAHIKADGKRVTIGTFHSAVEAGKAYDAAAIAAYGDFAHLNFPANKPL